MAAPPPGADAAGTVTVAFDALGAESGPRAVIDGVRAAASEGIGVRVFGRAADLGELDGAARGGGHRLRRAHRQRRGAGSRRPLPPGVLDRPRGRRRRRRRLRRAREPRLDRRDDDRRALRAEADPRRPASRPRRPVAGAGTGAARADARRRRERGRPALPSRPVRPPRLRLRRRRSSPSMRPGSRCSPSARRGRRAAPSSSRPTGPSPRRRGSTSPATSRAGICSIPRPTSSSPTASPATSS